MGQLKSVPLKEKIHMKSTLQAGTGVGVGGQQAASILYTRLHFHSVCDRLCTASPPQP